MNTNETVDECAIGDEEPMHFNEDEFLFHANDALDKIEAACIAVEIVSGDRRQFVYDLSAEQRASSVGTQVEEQALVLEDAFTVLCELAYEIRTMLDHANHD
jgi:hypothetical protein